jgi:hypothetical protein
MDLSRLRQGEQIAAGSAIALILIMFIFDWYSVSVAGHSVPNSGANAWESFSFIDIVLFVTALAAIAMAYISASGQNVNLPIAMSAIVAGLGILSVLLVLFRIIDTPGDTGAASAFLGANVDVSREIGVFLGLIATAGIAYGGYTAMQDEGTSFSDTRDRLSDRMGGPGPGSGGGTGGTGGTPPPPSGGETEVAPPRNDPPPPSA